MKLDADRAAIQFQEICEAWCEFGVFSTVGVTAGHELLRGDDDLASDIEDFLKIQEKAVSYRAEYLFLPDRLNAKTQSQLLVEDEVRGMPGMAIGYNPHGGYNATVFAGRLKGMTFWKAIRAAGQRKFLAEISESLDVEGEKQEWTLYESKSAETKLIKEKIPPDEFNDEVTPRLAVTAKGVFGTDANILRFYMVQGPEGLRALEPRAASISEVQFSRLCFQSEVLFEQRASLPQIPGISLQTFNIPLGSDRVERIRYFHFWHFSDGKCRLGVRVLDGKISSDDVPMLEKHLGVGLEGA